MRSHADVPEMISGSAGQIQIKNTESQRRGISINGRLRAAQCSVRGVLRPHDSDEQLIGGENVVMVGIVIVKIDISVRRLQRIYPHLLECTSVPVPIATSFRRSQVPRPIGTSGISSADERNGPSRILSKPVAQIGT